jgi:predicted component of type VI protein secretion system
MAKLILSLNGIIQGEYALNKERILIGRKPDSDIRIDNLAVSSKHALIVTLLDDSFLEDLGSTNGTYVNGKRIKKHALKNGDVIGLGKHELKYVNEHATADDEEFEKTMIIRPASATAAVTALRTAQHAGTLLAQTASPSPAASPSMPLGRLHVLNGPIAGRALDLTKALITLGKPGVQVAVISRRPQGYFLTPVEGDSGGENYPIVNDLPIGPHPYHLHHNDIVELAGIKMRFVLNQ